jgi:hypothetical protein
MKYEWYKIYIGVVYRPPSSNFDSFKQSINEILETVDRENKLCYLMGDFNIDLFISESCDYANYFTEQLFTSSFFPLITKATRITHHTATLIDNIFTNNLEQLDDSINDISDHLPVVHMFNTNMFGKNARENVNNVTYQRIFNEITNTEAFKNAIQTLSWDNILNETNDAEKAYIMNFWKCLQMCTKLISH